MLCVHSVLHAGPSPEMQAMLDMHNTFRKHHQAQPLSWSAELAVGAAAQAATCTFSVDSSNVNGVNIFATSTSSTARALNAAVDFW